jgi:hypothetical protein
MRAAIIVDGKVDNTIEVDSLDVLEGVTLIEAPTASIGDIWDGEVFTAPVAPPTPDPVPVVPRSVTRRQARQALLLADLLDEVPVAIAALDNGTPEGKQDMRMAQIEWEDSLEFERARPLVIEIAAAIGLDEAALDQLFITAAEL